MPKLILIILLIVFQLGCAVQHHKKIHYPIGCKKIGFYYFIQDAVDQKRPNLVKMLIELAGDNFDSKEFDKISRGSNSESILHLAVLNKDWKMLKFLLNKDINRDLKNKQGHTFDDLMTETDKWECLWQNTNNNNAQGFHQENKNNNYEPIAKISFIATTGIKNRKDFNPTTLEGGSWGKYDL